MGDCIVAVFGDVLMEYVKLGVGDYAVLVPKDDVPFYLFVMGLIVLSGFMLHWTVAAWMTLIVGGIIGLRVMSDADTR